jgi:hypothetical protein
MTIDVRRAYFYAPAQRAVYIEIPIEDREPGDEDKVGKLNLSLYGTRDAALNWTAEYTKTLEGLGFVKGRASTCNFRHVSRDIKLTVHGDDFLVAGPRSDLDWLKTKMQQKYDIKAQLLGPEKDCQSEIKILNRIIRWGSSGLEYEPDQRHAEIVISELGLMKAKPVSTPSIMENAEKFNETPLSSEQAQKYRSLAARVNFLAQDRPDLQFASRRVSKHMSTPSVGSWEMLKRIGRYLKGAARKVQHFMWSSSDEDLSGYADSDWAGSRKDGKSTSGGAIMWGGHLLKSWSTSQTTVALSSGEAELYAVTKAAAQILGVLSMAADFGAIMNAIVHTDSTAAMGMGVVFRSGLGRTRHIRVQYLWIQEQVKNESFKIEK